MMKRTRVEDVQYGTRPGPGGVVGSGGGGGGVGNSGAGIVSGGVSIGAVVPGAHGNTIGIAGGITAGAIAHHRILTPQHGGAQTIAYMPSTTPAASNLKTTSTIVDNSNNATSIVGSVTGVVGISQIGATTGIQTGSSAVGGIPTQAVQYSTSYSVSSIPANSSNLKTTGSDGTVQIHVSTGGAGSNTAVAPPTTPQTNSIRQRTISGTQSNTGGGSNLSTPQQSQLVVTQTPPPPSSAQPPNGPVSTSTPQSGQPSSAPRLKVEDALSYLDQVKYQYADQPQIYNNFLDIMKEFKSHCIDTPGVIERVSTLFKGHTELIYGFNMFLPPGYKIEIHSDELGCSVPVVSMPSPPQGPPGSSSGGTIHNSTMISNASLPTTPHTIKTTSSNASTPSTHNTSIAAQIQQTGGAVNLMTHGGASLSQTTIHALNPPSQSPSHAHVTAVTAPANINAAGQQSQVQSVSVAPVSAHMPQNYSRDRERATITQQASSNASSGGANIVVGPATPNSLSDLSPHGAGSQHNLHHIQQAHQSILLGEATGQQNQPVEFNHAITYVNKIKNRFQNQPAKYKKFLEILHAYQKEQKVIKEGSLNQGKVLTEQEVYTQVAKLFGQDEDLLREFGQFLPDATNHQAAQYMSKTHNDHKRAATTGTLSGGAHISMSPAPSGSPLQLSSGATLSQIDTSVHAAAIGNLSAVNTSVSIKSYNNSQQQNHIVNTATGPNATGRNDIIYEKDYHGVSVHHHAAAGIGGHHGIGASTTANIRSNSGSGAAYEKETHRNNHHAVNQKYVTHSQNANVGISSGHHHNSKKSPSYSTLPSGVGPMPLITGSSSGIERSASGNINYGTAQGHHMSSNTRRQIDDGSLIGAPPAKRHKPICRDVSFSEASRKCTISDAAFFDKVRKALHSPEVYENFLRCLTLFNQEIVSKSELLGLVSPFLTKFPDLLRWFTDFLGSPMTQMGSSGCIPQIDSLPIQATQRQSGSSSHDRQSNHQSGEYAQEIDLATCKRLGASYCALPQSTVPKKCSGRTQLCREVLNDKWVSFPTWASEDSTFVTSRKTQFEETIYRTEDERFELDLVIEVNSATICVLEGVQMKMSRMSPEELARFHLDDYLGGTSQTIHQRAIHRIYGDKASEIIQGLKKNPSVAVPILIKRLRAKEEEWREAQKGFNKQWREQNEKYYLKSLDHQAINFKPNDMKSLRSKSLFNEIETLYDERHDQEDENGEPLTGPHLILPYKDKTILDDAANLLIHHVKRQTGIQKQEKTKIKHILRQFVPDLFFTARQPLSEDERDDDDNEKMEVDSTTTNPTETSSTTTTTTAAATTPTTPTSKNNKTSTGLGASGGSSTTIKTEISDVTASTSAAATAATTSSLDIKENTIGGSSSINLKRCDTSTTDVVITDTTTTPTTTAEGIKVEIKQETDEDIRLKTAQQQANNKVGDDAYTLFFANNNWYLFFRLHAILCERLSTMYERARILTLEEEKTRVNQRESAATALRLKTKPDIQVEDYYPTFLDMLKNVLDGNMDSNTFEDSMREMFGIHAYISFTLDKVVSNAVRQLQNCVTEKAALDCVELFTQEQRRGGGATTNIAGATDANLQRIYERAANYQRRAENTLSDENCFKVYIYKNDCRVTIEMLDPEVEETEKPINKAKNWSKYVERLANPNGSSASSSNTNANTAVSSENIVDIAELKTENPEEDVLLALVPRKPRFLKRNKRKSRLMEEHLRLMFEQKNNVISAAGATTTTTATTATAATNTTTTSLPNASTKDSANNNDISTKQNANVTTTATTRPHFWNVKRIPTTTTTESATQSNSSPNISNLVDKYIFNDRDEISLNPVGGCSFLTNKSLKFFKYGAVRRAKMSHLRVTQKKYNRFQKFQTKWLTQHVSTEQQQHCNDWLLGKTAEITSGAATITWATAPKTKAMLQVDMKKTPYRIFNRYKVFPNGTVATTTTATTTSVAGVSTGVHAITDTAKHCSSSATSASSGAGNTEATTATLQQVRPMES